MINALGENPEAIWSRLISGDTSCLRRQSGLIPDHDMLVGLVDDPLTAIPAALAEYDCRNNRLTLAALEQLHDGLDDVLARYGRGRVAVVAGTSTSGVLDAEQAIRHRVAHGTLDRHFRYAQLEFGGISDFIAAWLGVTGPAYTLSTACSSGARALASARSLVEMGVADAVVCGATDTICGLTAGGFSSLGVVAPDRTNPFSANRCGLTLGESAAFFLVERGSDGIAVLGVGESSEAHHMSSPDPAGAGAKAAMLGALADAGMRPEEIAYLNLHGTGTPSNDSMEAIAVAEVFPAGVPVSSTKPLVGHTLGAAGATEAGFCWQVLANLAASEGPQGSGQSGSGQAGSAAGSAAAADPAGHAAGGSQTFLRLPPHVWDGQADPELPALDFVAAGRSVAVRSDAAVMTNSFGFGGNNCTLILGRRI